MPKKIKISKEILYNLPNFFTAMRVLLSLLIVLMYFYSTHIIVLLYIFLFAAFTDFLDGYLARKYHQETLFGAKFDILADRLLWGVFGLILLFGYPELYSSGNFGNLVLIFSREILCGIFLFFYIVIFGKREFIPYVRWSGKITTVLQSLAIPLLILDIYYPIFYIFILCVYLTAISGLVSTFYYIFDLALLYRLRKTQFVKYYNFLNPTALAPYIKKK